MFHWVDAHGKGTLQNVTDIEISGTIHTEAQRKPVSTDLLSEASKRKPLLDMDIFLSLQICHLLWSWNEKKRT
jgi:hypothetical protein